MNLRALWRFLTDLKITQGEGAGGQFELLPWQKRALRGALGPDVRTAAVTLGRGGGKSTLFASVASAAVAADVRSGILRGFSSEFRALEERDENGVRIIRSAVLEDLALVASPAYPQSRVEIRKRVLKGRRIWL